VFCEIVAGRSPASVVHGDDDVVAFLDVMPINAGHTLVVPRVHAAELSELDPRVGGRMFQVAQHVTAAVRAAALPCDGVNLFLADGAAAGQEVFHAHLHVIPRRRGDGLRISLKYPPVPTREALDEIASTLRAAVPAPERAAPERAGPVPGRATPAGAEPDFRG